MSDHDKEQLEYNDGIGDLLRNKDTRKFSWIKTGVTLILFIIGVFATLNFLFSYGKSILSKPVDKKTEVLNEQFQSDFNKIEDANTKTNQEIDAPATPATDLPTPAAENLEEQKSNTKSGVKLISKSAPQSTPAITPEKAVTVTKPEVKLAPKPIINISKSDHKKPEIKEIKTITATLKKEPKATKKSGSPFKIISGSFDNIKSANDLKVTLTQKGYPSFIKTISQNGKPLYQVQSGAFSSKAKATQFKTALDKHGVTSAIVEE